jgi:copper chaperone CopZ
MTPDARTLNTGTSHDTFLVRNIHCAVCAATLEKVVSEIPGVVRAEVDPTLGWTRLDYDRSEVSEDELEALVEAAGYEIVHARG